MMMTTMTSRSHTHTHTHAHSLPTCFLEPGRALLMRRHESKIVDKIVCFKNYFSMAGHHRLVRSGRAPVFVSLSLKGLNSRAALKARVIHIVSLQHRRLWGSLPIITIYTANGAIHFAGAPCQECQSLHCHATSIHFSLLSVPDTHIHVGTQTRAHLGIM